jgi:hypothetical protein
MLRSIFSATTILILAACGAQETTGSQAQAGHEEFAKSGDVKMTVSKDASAKPDWTKLTCDSPSSLSEINGLTEVNLESTFGPSQTSEIFALGDKQDEFHISLQNKYPLSKKGNKLIQIKEMTWIGPKCKITVWLDQQGTGWRTFDSLIYSKESEF